MKKTLALSALALSMAVASIPLAGPVIAQSDNAATVTQDGLCGGFVPSPSGGFGPFMIGNLHSVVTSSGVSMLVCKFDIPEAIRPATATQATGFLCGTFLGLTNDSRMTASPGGQATLVCKVRP
ncbi:MAG: hypothetical protein ACREBO_05225 [Novosphingobium sp.]